MCTDQVTFSFDAKSAEQLSLCCFALYCANIKGHVGLLLVINCNFFGLISHRFWYTATYWLRIINFSYPLLFTAVFRIFRKALRSLEAEPFADLEGRFRLCRFDRAAGCDRQRDAFAIAKTWHAAMLTSSKNGLNRRTFSEVVIHKQTAWVFLWLRVCVQVHILT